MWPSNFSESEFACKGKACCNGSAPMDSEFLSKIQELRDAIERPIKITSGFRCNHHNAHVGGAKKSYHTLGRACDIQALGVGVDQLAEYAREIFGGVIIYNSWVHIDTRKRVYHADTRN